MSNFHEVLIGLITALIGYIVGWLGKAVTDRRRYHRARGLWRTLVGPDITIVVGQHELTEWEASDLIGVGDAQALSELQRFLDRIGVSQPRIAYGSRMEGEARRNDMILIGGPDCNRVTHEVMLRSEGTLRFVDPQHNIVSIQDASGDTVYNPSVEGGEGTDYGLLIRVANPFDTQKSVLIIAGSFGYGTWGGVRLAIDEAFLKNPLVVDQTPFECLYKTDVAGEAPQTSKIIVIRPIS